MAEEIDGLCRKRRRINQEEEPNSTKSSSSSSLIAGEITSTTTLTPKPTARGLFNVPSGGIRCSRIMAEEGTRRRLSASLTPPRRRLSSTGDGGWGGGGGINLSAIALSSSSTSPLKSAGGGSRSSNNGLPYHYPSHHRHSHSASGGASGIRSNSNSPERRIAPLSPPPTPLSSSSSSVLSGRDNKSNDNDSGSNNTTITAVTAAGVAADGPADPINTSFSEKIYLTSAPPPPARKAAASSPSNGHLGGSPSKRRRSMSAGPSPRENRGDRFIAARGQLDVEICRQVLLSGARHETDSQAALSSSSSTTIATVTPVCIQPLQREYNRAIKDILVYNRDGSCTGVEDVTMNNLEGSGGAAGAAAAGRGGRNNGGGGASREVGRGGSDYGSHRVLSFNSKALSPSSPSPAAGSADAESVALTRLLGPGGSLCPMKAPLSTRKDKSMTRSRYISTEPYRVLDAPDIMDDYYLNLLSWSTSNVLAVGLGPSVYLWHADNGNIDHLTELEGDLDYICSLKWMSSTSDSGGCGDVMSPVLAVGTNRGITELWDCATKRKIRTMNGHSSRVSCLSWNDHLLSSGSKDATIVQHDCRIRDHHVATLKGHHQEVCGLSWSPDRKTLASGGNENYVCLWDFAMSSGSGSGGGALGGLGGAMSQSISVNGLLQGGSMRFGTTPRLTFTQHQAAVKALAWCPFKKDVLASGGGTQDRKINFWNICTGSLLRSVDTGSQVSSILWSMHHKELISGHGFSQNQLCLWSWPSMLKLKELSGHTNRVLHIELSPDGQTVVSAGADETLRFWRVFDPLPVTIGSRTTKGLRMTLGAVGAGGGGGTGSGIGGGIGGGIGIDMSAVASAAEATEQFRSMGGLDIR